MVRAKKQYRCTTCDSLHIKWAGLCPKCGSGGTLIEEILVPATVKKETDVARKIRRRAKDSERDIARGMLEADGPDPNFAKIASSTGRIGHITGIRVDAVSKNYFTENKNRRVPTWMTAAWLLINQRARDFDKHALLHIEPPNMPKDYVLNGVKYKLDTMAVITQPRHAELIRTERAFNELVNALQDIEGEIEGIDVLISNALVTLRGQGRGN
jgi:hypothetical protein